MSIHITEKIIRNYQLPTNRKSVVIADLELPGFGVQKTQAGSMSFIVRYRNAEGQQRQEKFATVGEMSVAEARAKANQLLTQHKQNRVLQRTKKSSCLLGPLMDDFFYTIYYPRIRLEARSHKTHAGLYRTHIQPIFGQKRMTEITEEEVLAFAHHLTNKPVGQGNYRKPVNRLLATGTINRIMILLRHLFNMAKTITSTNVTSSPVDAVKTNSERRFVGKFLTVEQLQRLLAAAEQSANLDFADIFKLLVGTGLRRNNVLRLQWDWYDPARGTISIPVEEDKGKRGMVVHLSTAMCQLLDSRRCQAEPDAIWVFPSPQTGKPYYSCRHAWLRVRELAGLPTLRMHDLRHTHASMMLEAGANLVEVQHALGHASINTTQIYTHISEKRRREQAERTAAALSIFN